MITLLMPTMNRPAHLKRALSYYKKVGIPARIIIVDSSCEKEKQTNKATIQELECLDFSPLYIECSPDTSYMAKINKGVGYIKTPYAALAADDDFFSAQGLQEAAHFLRNNKDYSFVQGFWSGFTYDEKITWYDLGELDNVRSFDAEDAWDRVNSFLTTYTVIFYSLFRTECLIRIMQDSFTYAQCGKFFENLYIIFALMSGKGKALPMPYIYREMMEHSMGRQLQRSWMLGKDFDQSIERFSLGIEHGLKRYLNLSEEDAKVRSKDIKNSFLDLVLRTSFSFQRETLPSFARKVSRILISRALRDHLLRMYSKYLQLYKTYRYKKNIREYLLRDPYKNEFYLIEECIKEAQTVAFMANTSMFTRIFP